MMSPTDWALKGSWEDPQIINDSRIDHEDETVRKVAERLHANESMHRHPNVGDPICVYCALVTSRVLRWANPDYVREHGYAG
jgi:hypothetical protein